MEQPLLQHPYHRGNDVVARANLAGHLAQQHHNALGSAEVTPGGGREGGRGGEKGKGGQGAGGREGGRKGGRKGRV